MMGVEVGAKRVKFQGKITAHSREVAQRLGAETLWPKHLVYDVVMLLGISHAEREFPPMDRETAVLETATTSRVKPAGSETAALRRKCKTSSAADVFRHSMHMGAHMLEQYLDDTLPADITRAHILDEIKTIVGNNAKYQDGLKNLP